MMQFDPIRVEWRMWTLSQIEVFRPIVTPGSTMAVGWMAIVSAGLRCYRLLSQAEWREFELVDRASDALPTRLGECRVSGGDHLDGRESVIGRHHQAFGSANCAAEV